MTNTEIDSIELEAGDDRTAIYTSWYNDSKDSVYITRGKVMANGNIKPDGLFSLDEWEALGVSIDLDTDKPKPKKSNRRANRNTKDSDTDTEVTSLLSDLVGELKSLKKAQQDSNKQLQTVSYTHLTLPTN